MKLPLLKCVILTKVPRFVGEFNENGNEWDTIFVQTIKGSPHSTLSPSLNMNFEYEYDKWLILIGEILLYTLLIQHHHRKFNERTLQVDKIYYFAASRLLVSAIGFSLLASYAYIVYWKLEKSTLFVSLFGSNEKIYSQSETSHTITQTTKIRLSVILCQFRKPTKIIWSITWT